MKKYALILTVIPFISVTSQNTVTCENLPKHGDKIIKEEVVFPECGNSGKDIIWDFSNLPVIASEYKIYYSCDSTLTAISPNTISLYTCDASGLKLIKFESPLITVDYNIPVTQIQYPMKYGDRTTSTFDGTGKYCNRYKLRRTGNIIHEADAIGTMLLTENDTLRNVIRIHTVKTCTVYMNTDNNDADTTKNIKQETEEMYTWYAQGYRYPVFETLSRTTYNNMQPVSSHKVAFRCIPEVQDIQQDTPGNHIRHNASQYSSKSAMTSRNITVHGSMVNVSYDMDAKAPVTFMIAGISGLIYNKKELVCDKGTGYHISIDCGRLHDREYILYINVDGNIESEKISIRR